MIEYQMTNEQLQIAIDATFNACNSVLQEHTSGGRARALAVDHLEVLYQEQRERAKLISRPIVHASADGR
jgi:hypothetical protein